MTQNLGVRIALFSAYFMFAILLNSVGTVILMVQSSFDITKEGASILEAFKDLPIAITSFFIASFLPRLGYRKALIAGFAIVALPCIAMPLVSSFATTKLLFLAVGVAFALVKVTVYSTIGLITKDSNHHASFLNTIEGFFMIGILSSYFLFAAFIDTPSDGDIGATSLGWLNVYWVLAVLSVANIVLLSVVDYPRAIIADKDQSVARDFADMWALFARPIVLVFLMAAFLAVLIEQGIMTWLPTFNKDVLFMPESMAVLVAGILAAASAIGRLSAGALLRKVDWYWLLNGCIVATVILVLVALPLAKTASPNPNMTWLSAPIAAFIFPLIGLFLAPIYPAVNSVILSSLPKGYHAAMAGLIVVFSALGGTLGSLITGRIFGAFDGTTAFYFSLVPITGMLVVLFFFRRLNQTQETPSGQSAPAE